MDFSLPRANVRMSVRRWVETDNRKSAQGNTPGRKTPMRAKQGGTELRTGLPSRNHSYTNSLCRQTGSTRIHVQDREIGTVSLLHLRPGPELVSCLHPPSAGFTDGDRRSTVSSPRLRRTISCRAPMVPRMASSSRAFMSRDFLNVRLLIRSKAFFPWGSRELGDVFLLLGPEAA